MNSGLLAGWGEGVGEGELQGIFEKKINLLSENTCSHHGRITKRNFCSYFFYHKKNLLISQYLLPLYPHPPSIKWMLPKVIHGQLHTAPDTSVSHQFAEIMSDDN